jgi:hypothetical protein
MHSLPHRRTKSTPEKRRNKTSYKQREQSNAAGTAQADIVRENNRLAIQRSRTSKENTPPPSQQASALSGEATTNDDARTSSCIGHVQPLAAMHTPASRQSDAPMPAAMTDSSARKGAALGIPPPADRVGGAHQSLGLDNEKALDAVYYREASLPIYHIHSH